MQTVRPKTHVYTSPKLRDTYTFVYMADLHVGSAQTFRASRNTVEAVRALEPDFVVLDGDTVDDYTSKADMEAFFGLFSGFDCPVYFVYGNHDRQGHAEYAGGRTFTQAELETALTENGVEILRDSYARIAPDLLLLGREDVSEDGRADIASLPNPAPEAYLITADHQPVRFKDNLAAGTDLQISGHTHAGQFFPLGPLYGLIGYCSGDYEADGAVMNVTDGACGWRTPFRTQGHCNYEVVTLRPAE